MKLVFFFIAIGLVVNEQTTHICSPGRGIGSNGKPRQYFIHKNNRKQAQQAVRHQDDGRPPIYHNERGKKLHFHSSNKHDNIRKRWNSFSIW
ncbi:unnamed protein product [Rotaria sordida]|uniref:Secreted protein n=1 Tax=Rotaria sordida TaxID=392033 RepID=A0A813NWB0_9BILA|nr:unnamed protein product [Rotaria sordida]CAF0746038.1 unnamed protein product [Rotaria sordida]CAF0747424.1 unnamed protein product [Rotaria sordida]CAF0781137.1 unnamed protein product [Rotaria sordida]CAF0814663.1 unnamed protein product [Rotaria sordida]